MSAAYETMRGLDDEQMRLLALLLEQEGLDLAEAMIPPRPDRLAPAPLSPAQQRFWMVDRLAADAGIASPNTSVRAWRIDGPLDSQRLQDALDELVRRHDILRTRFGVADGEAMQVIGPGTDCNMQIVEADGRTPDQLVEDECACPLDLAQDLPLRVTLARLAPDQHLLAVALHYAAADGVGEGIFCDELSALYNAATTEAAGLQYADYAAWRKDWFDTARAREHVEAWRQSLGETPATLGLASAPSGGQLSFAGETLYFDVDPALTAQVRQLARDSGVTPFTVLFGGFQSVVHRLTGAANVAVATTVSDRPRRELETMLGSFSNHVLVPARYVEGETFAGAISALREPLATAFANQSLAYEEYVEALALDPASGTAPGVGAVFVLHDHASEEDLRLDGLTVTPIEVAKPTVSFDLHLRLIDRGDSYAGQAAFRYGAFDAATVAGLVTVYREILEAMTREPAARVADVPITVVTGLAASSHTAPAVDRDRPRERAEGDLEQLIADTWAHILNVEAVGVTENIFDLGARSLHTTVARVRLEAALGRTIPIVAFFEHPTVRSLARSLVAAPEAVSTAAVDRASERRASRMRRASPHGEV